MTTLSATRPASNINFACLPPLCSTKAQLTHAQELNTSSEVVTHAPHLIKAVLPYPLNLTPSSSDLHPHCAAKDWLEKWLPHPDTLTALGFPATSELVMLWAWLGLKALAWAWPERAWA